MQDFHAAPNLDHSNETVRGDICEWLKWLRDTEFGTHGMWRVREVLDSTTLLRDKCWKEMEADNSSRLNKAVAEIHDKFVNVLTQQCDT